MRTIIIVFCTIFSASAWAADAGPRPDNYRELVVEYMKESFKDPASIRDAKISSPYIYQKRAVWQVCVEANAKNSMGGYVGTRAFVAWIQNGAISKITRATAGYDHSCDMPMEEFPEANKID